MSDDLRQRDIHPINPPIEAGEDPILRWLRYGLGDLFYAWAKERGLGTLHVVQFVVNEAVHEATQRIEREQHIPVGFRLDTSGMGPRRDDDPTSEGG